MTNLTPVEKLMLRNDVLRDVNDERDRQERKWGYKRQSPADRLAILAEEFGEVAKEVVEFNASGHIVHIHNAIEEQIQLAAVAVANVERLRAEYKKELDEFYGN